jgi:hypothetical protein
MILEALMLIPAAAAPSPQAPSGRVVTLWATSAQAGLESVAVPDPAPDLVIHMDAPDNLRLPPLPPGLAFNAAALDAGLVGPVLRQMGKRDRVQSRLHSVNVLDRDGDTLGRAYSLVTAQDGLRILVVGVTPADAQSPLRGVHTNPPAQAVRSLAQSVIRRLRYNLLVALDPENLGSAQAFAKEAGIADVVVYRRRPEGSAAFSYGPGDKGVKVALVPAPPEGFIRLKITAARAEERRFRITHVEPY